MEVNLKGSMALESNLPPYSSTSSSPSCLFFVVLFTLLPLTRPSPSPKCCAVSRQEHGVTFASLQHTKPLTTSPEQSFSIQSLSRRKEQALGLIIQTPHGPDGATSMTRVRRRKLQAGSPQKCLDDPDAPITWEDYPHEDNLTWHPQEGKFLLAVCRFGSISNQYMCLRKYVWFAALLQRTLLVPRLCFPWGYDPWNSPTLWEEQLSFPAMQQCLHDALGGTVPHIQSEQEYLAPRHTPCLHLDRRLLLSGMFEPVPQSRSLRWMFPNCTQVPSTDEKLLEEGYVVSSEVLEKLRGIEDSVITLGTLHWERVDGHDTDSDFFPFNLHPGCRELLLPSKMIQDLTGQALSLLGGSLQFAAMHLRRGDFAKVYKEGDPEFLSLSTVAARLKRWLEPLSVAVLYIASNGTPSELKRIESSLRSLPRPILCFHLHSPSLGLVDALEGADSRRRGVILAAVEKQICSHAKAFLATPRSTYSEDIQRLRVVNIRASCRDTSLADVVVRKTEQ